eukprot:433907-Prorocentrum_minimum.AAC.1
MKDYTVRGLDGRGSEVDGRGSAVDGRGSEVDGKGEGRSMRGDSRGRVRQQCRCWGGRMPMR